MSKYVTNKKNRCCPYYIMFQAVWGKFQRKRNSMSQILPPKQSSIILTTITKTASEYALIISKVSLECSTSQSWVVRKGSLGVCIHTFVG